MDIDISDILADVSRPLHTQSHPSQSQQQHLDSTTSFSDHQLLVRAWTSERCSPSLLPYPTTLIERTMQRIQDQITRIEDLTSGMSDPYAINPANTTTTTTGGANTNLILSIYQTDLSRTQFIVRSYLRQRLAKITKFAVYYLKQHVENADQEDKKTSNPLLSPVEVSFLRNHQALLSRFYDDSFLGAFPENLRRLDDKAGGNDMVEGPDGGAAVVVRCLADTWGNEEDVLEGRRGGEGHEGAQTELRMRRGEVWVVRWRDVGRGVVGGMLELL